MRDDKLNPGEATRRTLQLIEKDKVNFVAGALSSAVQSAVQLSINNVTNERHIIYNSISQSDTIKRPKTGARILFMRQ